MNHNMPIGYEVDNGGKLDIKLKLDFLQRFIDMLWQKHVLYIFPKIHQNKLVSPN